MPRGQDGDLLQPSWISQPLVLKRQASFEKSFSSFINPTFLAAQRKQAEDETIYREYAPSEYSQSICQQKSMKIKGELKGNISPAFFMLAEHKAKTLFQTRIQATPSHRAMYLRCFYHVTQQRLGRCCAKSPAIKKRESGNFLCLEAPADFPVSSCQYRINTTTASNVVLLKGWASKWRLKR